jgi:predicted PurR-regulated permease PerM
MEVHILAPTFYGRVMGLHPAVVLMALLIGAKAKGVLGVLFAAPVAVVLSALLEELRAAVIETEADLVEETGPPAEPGGQA